MKVFLTLDDMLDDVEQPIECEIACGQPIEREIAGGWQDWGAGVPFVVFVEHTFSVRWQGQPLEVSRLILAPVQGQHAKGPFFDNNAWVNVFLPAGTGSNCDLAGGRLGGSGLIHRTLDDAIKYAPSKRPWDKRPKKK